MYMFMSIVLKITTNTLEVHVLVIQINFNIRVFFRRYLKADERLISTLHHADKASASMHSPLFFFNFPASFDQKHVSIQEIWT